MHFTTQPHHTPAFLFRATDNEVIRRRLAHLQYTIRRPDGFPVDRLFNGPNSAIFNDRDDLQLEIHDLHELDRIDATHPTPHPDAAPPTLTATPASTPPRHTLRREDVRDASGTDRPTLEHTAAAHNRSASVSLHP